jgi:hypothetical protein
MKNYFYSLILSLPIVFVSCQKDTIPASYDASKITVTVLDFSSNTATISLFAKDIKDLGAFKVGICISTNPEPTIADPHFELDVNPDTITGVNLDLECFLTDLNKGTDYYLKGYIIINAETYYSVEETFKTTNNTLTITVSNDYVPSGMEYWVVLSDNGTTILKQKLQNSKTYTFSDNIPDLADFHLYRLNTTVTPNTLYVESYTDIIPDNFQLDYTNSSTNAGLVTVTVSDVANFLRWGIATSWWSYSTPNPAYNSLTTYLSKNPDDLFIHYLPSDGSAPKYKFVPDVTPSSTYTYSMADLTTLTNFKEIVLPENNYFTYTLAGLNTDYYTEYLKYHGHSYATGYPGTFKLYYPTGIKSNYYLYTFFNNSSQQSFYNKLGALPTTVFSTFPAITIENSSQFITTTSSVNGFSTYEIMDFCGMYSTASLYVQWDYYKQPQTSNSVQIPEFPSEIALKINNLTINDLSFSDVGYFDILNSEVNSYTSYVDLLIKQSSRFFDVIKERRQYYQWVNKKSFDKTTKNYNLPEFK